jgi:hypothetical protein
MFFLPWLYFLTLLASVQAFAPSRTPISIFLLRAKIEEGEALPIPTSEIVKKVGVVGATGRTGKFVVEELLKRNVEVVAMVRTIEKAKETFQPDPNLNIIQCDLTNEKEIETSLNGCDSTIWCATGFSDAKMTVVERLKRLLGIALAPKQSIDSVGIPLIAKCMLNKVNGFKSDYPKLIMLSSAGVTRPQWDDAKKEKLSGCADIPIVRLNPVSVFWCATNH